MARRWVTTELTSSHIQAYMSGTKDCEPPVLEYSSTQSVCPEPIAPNDNTSRPKMLDYQAATEYVEHYRTLDEQAYLRLNEDPNASSFCTPVSDLDDVATMDQLETRSMTSCATRAARPRPVSNDATGDASVFSSYRVKSLVYDSRLPITSRKSEVIEAIEGSQVTVIRGSTGSGKTTQVPQYILEHYASLGKPCNIVVTQPRRIAAISVAKRVCQERGWPLGSLCGYQVGMDKRTSDDTRLRYVTTGVLLQQLINAKNMYQYTHVILDEVHERDQDTDLVLLIIRKLLRTNSRFTKVILMSATIDCDLFAEYFSTLNDGALKPAPIVSVEGKIYDVAEYYLEDIVDGNKLSDLKRFFENAEPTVITELQELAAELIAKFDDVEAENESGQRSKRGTVLVFLPGLAEIQSMETCLMESIKASHRLLLIPLHSTITIDEQARAFEAAPPGMRKVIISTNIAESSVTVPDIKYVIDFCLTKNLVCDPDTNYTSLKLEWASKANCTQRKGRAGRVSAGRAYRLLTRHFYHNMLPQYSTPEMLRCPLEMLILHVKLLDLGEPKALLALALTPPKLADLERSVLLLKEVGALSSPSGVSQNPHDGRLTFVGQVLAHLPVDVRLGKLIVFGHVFGLVDECIILAASLSARTVFARPRHCPLEAYNAKLQWAAGSGSDCVAALNAYKEWDRLRKNGYFQTARNREADWCREKFLQRQRLYEVAEVVRELECRLRDFNIHSIQLPPHARRERNEQQDMFILKIVIAAAFYPNYFSCGSNNEQMSDRSMLGKDCFNTVMLKSIPINQGVLYLKDIERLMAPCSKNLSVSLEESRAYVEFSRAEASPDEKIHRGVYLAIKMRLLSIPLMITLWSTEESRTHMQEIVQRQSEQASRSNRLRTNRICAADETDDVLASEKTGETQVALPDPFVKEIPIVVTYVEECGHFWAYYGDDDTVVAMSDLQATIGGLVDEVDALPANELRTGSLCLAPYRDDNGDEQYYRARIEQVMQVGSHGTAEVKAFFVDYGNRAHVDASRLKCLPPAVKKLNFQAVEYQLASVKPSQLRSDAALQWSTEATQWFCNLVYGATVLVAQVYSVIGRIVRVNLVEQHPSGRILLHINESLVDKCFADKCAESFVSVQNHNFREKQRNSMAMKDGLSLAVGHLDDRHGLPSGRTKFNLHADLTSQRSGPKARLSGPHSPLEMSFYSMANVGRMRRVSVDWESVNSVSLNRDPLDRHERLMVAGTVTVNMSGSVMQARTTTLMPNIHGLPALLAILFSPAVELRTDRSKQRYTGALCGLGMDAESKRAALADHDMEITFDTKFDLDDIIKINAVRLAINVALGADHGFVSLSDVNVMKIQDNARKRVLELLEKRRESMERYAFEEPYCWGMTSAADLMQLNTELGVDAFGKGDEQLLNLIQAIHLNDGTGAGTGDAGDETASAAAADAENTRLTRDHLRLHSKWLWKKAEQRSSAREHILCELCNRVVNSTKELSAHLSTRTHQEEERLLF